jgi:hypothetical protein
MSDAISFRVPVPYRQFSRRWQRALRGTWSRRLLMAFHRSFGVYLRAHPRLMEVAYLADDGRWRRAWLNPTQICYIAEL